MANSNLSKQAVTVPASAPIKNVGRLLKKARTAKKISLDDLSARLKIRKVYLKAIEENDLENMPERIFAQGYVRAYAKVVGLDPDEITTSFLDAFKDQDPQQLSSAPQIIIAPQRPKRGHLYFSFLLFTVGLFFAWTYKETWLPNLNAMLEPKAPPAVSLPFPTLKSNPIAPTTPLSLQDTPATAPTPDPSREMSTTTPTQLDPSAATLPPATSPDTPLSNQTLSLLKPA